MVSDLVKEFLEDYLKRTPYLPDNNPPDKLSLTTKQDLINILSSVELVIRWNKDKKEWFVWAFATDITDAGIISMTLIFGNEVDLVAATHSMEIKLKKLKENYALEKIENDFN